MFADCSPMLFFFCCMLPLDIDGFADGDPLRVIRQHRVVVPLLVLLALFWQIAKGSAVVCYRYVLLHCLHFLHFHLPTQPSVAAVKPNRRNAA